MYCVRALTLMVSRAPISVECLFSMTLLPEQPRSMMSSLGSMVAEGLAFSTGSAIAHRAIGRVSPPPVTTQSQSPTLNPPPVITRTKSMTLNPPPVITQSQSPTLNPPPAITRSVAGPPLLTGPSVGSHAPSPDCLLIMSPQLNTSKMLNLSEPTRERASYAVFQGTSNGGRQFLRNRPSNRHNVPLYSYGKSDRLFTQGRKFAHR